MSHGKKGKNSKQAWLEWLSDDPPAPVAQVELRQKRLERANHYMPRAQQPAASQPVVPKPVEPSTAGVSIQINLPPLKKPQFGRAKTAWAWSRAKLTKRQLIIGANLVAVVIFSWTGAALTRHKLTTHSGQTNSTQSGGATADVSAAKLSFTPVVPSTKHSLATPDNTHSRYDATKQSYSYVDTIDGKQFTVSQQQLASAADAQKASAQAAKSLNALVTLKTGWGTAYVLTNQKYNSQSLAFSVQDRLMFIQSSFVLTNDQWTTYIDSLQ